VAEEGSDSGSERAAAHLAEDWDWAWVELPYQGVDPLGWDSEQAAAHLAEDWDWAWAELPYQGAEALGWDSERAALE
jgi:hypothetical protein